jgi:glycosyltransferase involved in cell wall biosynthesis
MKILVVCPLLPFPLIDGARKGVYYPIKALAERGHSVHLFCLTHKIDPSAVESVKRYCTVDVVESAKSPRILSAIRKLPDYVPYDLERFHNEVLLRRMLRSVAESKYDVMQVEGIHAARYGLEVPAHMRLPIVLRVHNVQHVNLLRMAQTRRNPAIKLYLKLEGRKVRKYESIESKKFDVNMVVSDQDARVLHSLDPAINTMTVPAGVELSDYAVRWRDPEPGTVVWLGALGWPPNRDSFWWFYRSIVPRIVEQAPAVRIRVIGSNPPPDILGIRHPNVHVQGFMPDIRESMQAAEVCVVPLQIGSGIRIKLLEMFAMRKAVVSTSVGCEGLGVTHGEHLLIADTPADFSRAVVRLLRDPSLRRALGERAYDLVEKEFTWSTIVQGYEEAYRQAIVLNSSRSVSA